MPHPFFEPVSRHFKFLQDEYGFRVVSEQYDIDGFGAGLVRMQSDHYLIDFQVDGLGPEVTMHIGKIGRLMTDMAWIFAYLTRETNPTPTGAAPWLYYFPHFTLGLWDSTSVAWQMERLFDILQPMWPAIFIFLDMDGPQSANFIAFQDQASRAAVEEAADSYIVAEEKMSEHTNMNFVVHVQRSFTFMRAYGFKLARVSPLLVRYETPLPEGQSPEDDGPPRLYVNVFHRLHSFQVGVQFGRVQKDASFELNLDLEELAAWQGINYHPLVASTEGALQNALNRTARLFRRLAASALAGDMRLLEALHTRRIDAARRASRAWAERSILREKFTPANK